MKKYFNNSIVNWVLTVLLLHIAIPHANEKDVNNAEHSIIHQNKNTLFDFLKFFFHENAIGDLDNLPYNKIMVKNSFSTFRINLQGLKNISNIDIANINLHRKKKEKSITCRGNYFFSIVDLRAPPFDM